MLVVSRRADEAIQIKLADGADGNLTLNDLFAKGPIEITLLGSSGRRRRLRDIINCATRHESLPRLAVPGT